MMNKKLTTGVAIAAAAIGVATYLYRRNRARRGKSESLNGAESNGTNELHRTMHRAKMSSMG